MIRKTYFLQNIKSAFGTASVSVLGLLLVACQPQRLDSSRVGVYIPSADSFRASGKVSAQALTDYAKMCFYVNVLGPGIPSLTGQCQVERGIFSVGVPQNSTIELDVPVGDSRIFQIYGYERIVSTEVCPGLATSVSATQLRRFYLLGSSQPTVIQGVTETVEVGVTLPDQANNIVAQTGMPSSCLGTSMPATVASIKPASAEFVGSSFKLVSHVSSVQGAQFNGVNFKLKGRVRDR